METEQHGNASTQKPIKLLIFLSISAISLNFSELPQNSDFKKFPLFFDRLTKILNPFPLYFNEIFLRGFLIFSILFRLFLIRLRYLQKLF